MKDKLKELSDEELVQVVCDSDQEAYYFLVERYEDKLIRYATRLLNDHEKAQDIAQDSFIKAFKNLRSFNQNKKFSSWIYRIVHNESVSEIRKTKNTIDISKLGIESEENIEDSFIKKELQQEVGVCLSKIPTIYSEPLILYYLEGKKYDEISDVLKIPQGTVATRLNRAKQIMKKICLKK